jgi:hypothetical protein
VDSMKHFNITFIYQIRKDSSSSSVQKPFCKNKTSQYILPLSRLTSPALVRARIHMQPTYVGTKTITVPPGNNVLW